MSYYSTTPLDDRSMKNMTGSDCVGYGTGESHARIIQGAGGEIGRDGFMDPRPDQFGEMVADKVFINQRDNTIQGINFRKNGEFCCSYTGMNYNDIKDSNRRDCAEKMRQSAQPTESKTLQRQRSERLSEPSPHGNSRYCSESNSIPKNNKIKH